MNRFGIGLICLIAAYLPDFAVAADPPASVKSGNPSEAAHAKKDHDTAAANPAKPPPTPEQKRKAVVVSTMLMVGVLTVLLCLFLWVMWWSRRTRQLLRTPLPAANRGDELWYLKTKNPPAKTPDPAIPPPPPAPPAA